MNRSLVFTIVFLCSTQFCLYGVDWWMIGLEVIRPFWAVIVHNFFTKDPKTERDRVNEALSVQVALLNSPNISPELKKNVLNAIMRDEEKIRCLDIKEYLQHADIKKEDKDLVAWAQQEIQNCNRKHLEVCKNTV